MYSYQNFLADLEELRTLPGVETFPIGKSVMGKTIPCIKVGSGAVRIQVNAVHHALESITGALALRFCQSLVHTEILCGYDTAEILRRVSYFIIPMVNPDGVEAAAGELLPDSIWYKRLRNDFGTMDFSRRWSANINGVDLNHNYDAGFWEQIAVLRSEGIMHPGPTRYPGECAFDQPESRALAEFTAKAGFDMMICLHTQGREIYYDYNGFVPPGGEELAARFGEVSGYRLSKPEGCACWGGCKDWFIETFQKPAFTIEAGEGKNPLPLEDLSDLEDECFPILLEAGLFQP